MAIMCSLSPALPVMTLCPALGRLATAGEHAERVAAHWFNLPDWNGPEPLFGERHLRRVLGEYEACYNGRRPYRSRQLRPPLVGHPAADLSQQRIKRRPVLGGLLNEYERAA